jgi:anti-sigma factor RsiW
MICQEVQKRLPDLLLDRERVPVEMRAHVADCAECGKELKELEATMALMDAWAAPEISPYFDGKMAVRLREEKEAAPANWLERMRARLLFGNSMSMRPLAAAALALAVAVGGGMYAGFSGLGHQAQPTPVQAASPVIQDLQSLDENSQVFQQLNAMEQDTSDSSAAPNGNL